MPELPIIDTHHHLWHRQEAAGQPEIHGKCPRFAICSMNTWPTARPVITSSAAYSSSATPCIAPPARSHASVGETEFVAGAAAMSDSGGYGKARICAGIVGFADLTAGDWVTPVLEAHIRAAADDSGGVRHSARTMPIR